jgi:gamma-glutamyltranspeptidase
MLGMVEKEPLKAYGWHSPTAVHVMVEAERRAFADRATYLGDPDYYPDSGRSTCSKPGLPVKSRMRKLSTQPVQPKAVSLGAGKIFSLIESERNDPLQHSGRRGQCTGSHHNA